MNIFEDLMRASYGIKNEEDTKQVLVLPMLNVLGYDVGFNTNLRYEYYVNGEAYGKKVDIVVPEINVDKFVSKIYIEVKAKNKSLWDYHTQITDYLDLTPYSVLGVLTNGIEYDFFYPNFYDPFFTINFANFCPNVPNIDYCKLNIFMTLLGQETSNKERLSLEIKLLQKLNIEVSSNSNIKLNKIIKMLPKEATSSSITNLAIDCFDRYFTNEQIEMEFKRMNKWCS